MIDKRIFEKRFIWNPGKCECKWKKSHDFGEHLNYENCRWKKKLVDKLVKEHSENTDKIEIYDGYENVYSSSTIYIALFVIGFLIIIVLVVHLFIFIDAYKK